MLVLILVALVAVLTAAFYLILSRRYSTWQRKGVPGPPASAFPLGVPKLLRGHESMGDVADRIYKQYRDSPIAGSYVLSNPVLHLHDPEVIKHVLIKEFQDFSGRGITAIHEDLDPLAQNLFSVSGPKWRNLRVKLAPTFTSGKIKYMFETIRESSDQLAAYLDERIAANGGSHCEDARPLMMRLFVDTISSVAFGIQSNVVKNPDDSEFFKAVQKAVEPSLGNAVRAVMSLFGRTLVKALRMRSVESSTHEFFSEMVRQTVTYREQNNVQRADMLNLLIQLKNKGFVAADKNEGQETTETSKLTMGEVAAQVFIFMIAGFESSAGTTSFTLYELAKQPKLLEKALKEVDQVMADFDGKISYEAIMSMPYLDMCINETLRKYPPLAFITREAVVTRKVPHTDVLVDAGTTILVPIRALHYDPQYWPEPERYDPDRFTEEEKATRPASCYLPFGDGPRICIAARLGLVQIKTALLRLLSKYTVTISDESSTDKVKINPRAFATTPEIPLNVSFSHRTPAADVHKRRQSVNG